MKSLLYFSLFFTACTFGTCQNNQLQEMSEEEIWRLGWRLVDNAMHENLTLAELQFDSLLTVTDHPERPFLITGLETKLALGKKEFVEEMLSREDLAMLRRICLRESLRDVGICTEYSEEKVQNKKLQLELVEMYVNDQAVRDNLKEDIITKYELDRTKILDHLSMEEVDEINRNRLKAIFAEFGFPNLGMVGKDAMQGVFWIIQHSDREEEWQKSQLINIERAVKAGDLDAQLYAYLYDRIKANAGEEQRYGTQFAKVDPVSKIVELKATEDAENLDARRREIGLMPIEMYKRMVFETM